MTEALGLPSGETFRQPRPRRVKAPKAPSLRSRNQFEAEREALGPQAISQLQQERYALWPLEAQQFARTKDAQFALWSCTHRWRPATNKVLSVAGGDDMNATQDLQWSYDWSSMAAIYVGGDMGLRELSVASGIHLRRVFWASSRYGWAQQKETHRILREQEEKAIEVTDVTDAARTAAIRSRFTKVGLNLLDHCMAALNRSVDSIEPRDIAPLMDKAIRLIGAGEKMPTEYRHSVVDNPNALPNLGAGTVVNGNAVILTSEGASRELAMLHERLARLGVGTVAPSAVEAVAIPAR